jgi:Tfp pilus assembly protein PilF
VKNRAPVIAFILSLVFVVILQSHPVEAQRQTSPQAPSSPARPDSIQDSGFYNYWANMSGQGKAGGVLLGKLELEGEPLPWVPLLVAVECKGEVVNRTQTDSAGQFVIQFVDQHGVEAIPKDAQRQMETKYEGCLVKGTLAGFRSSQKTITINNLRDEPNLGTITLSPEDRGGGSEVSSTMKSAPPAAVKAYEKARSNWLAQDVDGAQKNLRKSVEVYPGFADAWLQLGRLRAAADPQSARDAYAKAMEADPKFILPYEQLAAMDIQDQKWQHALEYTSRGLALDAVGTPQLWYYDALAKFQLGKVDAAQASAQKALDVDPRHTVPNSEQLLALAMVRKGDYAGGLRHLKNCLSYTPSGPGADLLKQQIALVEQKKKAK